MDCQTPEMDVFQPIDLRPALSTCSVAQAATCGGVTDATHHVHADQESTLRLCGERFEVGSSLSIVSRLDDYMVRRTCSTLQCERAEWAGIGQQGAAHGN